MNTNTTNGNGGHRPPLQTFDFIPADTLFCRDQKPLAAGSSFGHGANWPLPTVLHSAIRTALLRANGGLPARNGAAGRPHKGVAKKVASQKYQWLNLRGPFPVDKNGVTYFPRPLDLVPGKDKTLLRLQVSDKAGQNNLPKTLKYLLTNPGEPSKEEMPAWVTLGFYNDYLAGNDLTLPSEFPKLWESEHRIGVAIDPETHTAAEGQLYAAEHLRLRDGVRLRFAISEPPKHKPANPDEPIALADKILQLGGEQRFGKVEKPNSDLELPETKVTGLLVKWVLLTPAIFIHGWRPGWISDDGSVKLRVVDKSNGKRADRRRPRYDDKNWKYDESADTAPPIAAKLVAACVGKPQVVGGWDDAPKPTYLAVPSGSVYYFQAGEKEQSEDEKLGEARKLMQSLQHRCKSDFFGEKGLGLGVCGTWRVGSGA